MYTYVWSGATLSGLAMATLAMIWCRIVQSRDVSPNNFDGLVMSSSAFSVAPQRNRVIPSDTHGCASPGLNRRRCRGHGQRNGTTVSWTDCQSSGDRPDKHHKDSVFSGLSCSRLTRWNWCFWREIINIILWRRTGPRLLLRTNRKPHTRFRLAKKINDLGWPWRAET